MNADRKSQRINGLVQALGEAGPGRHYFGYFVCFNRGEFFAAHDVLEQAWLPRRQTELGRFYQGLIQLAGAFVHLQRDCARYPRLRPAAALFQLARANLEPFAPEHQGLDVTQALRIIDDWTRALETQQFRVNPLHQSSPPQLWPRRCP